MFVLVFKCCVVLCDGLMARPKESFNVSIQFKEMYDVMLSWRRTLMNSSRAIIRVSSLKAPTIQGQSRSPSLMT